MGLKDNNLKVPEDVIHDDGSSANMSQMSDNGMVGHHKN